MSKVKAKFRSYGEWYECKVLSTRLLGLQTLIEYQAQLDYGFPVFIDEKWIMSWRVKHGDNY